MMKVVYFAPEGFGYSTNQVAEGFHLLSKDGIVDFYCTNKVVHHGNKLEDLQLTSQDDAWREAQDADMCIVGTDGDGSFHEGYSGRCIGDKRMMDKTVFIDGSDTSDLLLEAQRVCVYFKREVRVPMAYTLADSNIRQHSFGLYDFHFDSKQPGYSDRKIDVAFVAFGGSSQMRQQVADIASRVVEKHNLSAEIHVQQDGQPFSIEQYQQIMRSAKVGLSTWGAGLDTLRFWETMGYGAALVSCDMSQLYMQYPPRHNEHCLQFAHGSILEHNILRCLDEVHWNRIRRNADRMMLKHHSTRARAMQMIEQFKEFV